METQPQHAAFAVRDIERNLAAARNALEASEAKRAKLAYAVVQGRGGLSAKRELEAFDRREAETRRRIADLESARVEAKRLEDAARVADNEAQAARRLATAKQIAAQLIEQSAMFDTALVSVVAIMSKRKELRTQLQATGCVNSDDMAKLNCAVRINCALRVSGAAQFLLADKFVSAIGCSPLAIEDQRSLEKLLRR